MVEMPCAWRFKFYYCSTPLCISTAWVHLLQLFNLISLHRGAPTHQVVNSSWLFFIEKTKLSIFQSSTHIKKRKHFTAPVFLRFEVSNVEYFTTIETKIGDVTTNVRTLARPAYTRRTPQLYYERTHSCSSLHRTSTESTCMVRRNWQYAINLSGGFIKINALLCLPSLLAISLHLIDAFILINYH